MKILITSATFTVAHQLKKQLNQSDIVLGDFTDLPAIMLKSGSMLNLPNPADTSYAHKMLTLCLDNQIEMVYALQPAEFNQLNEAFLLFTEYGITILSAADEI